MEKPKIQLNDCQSNNVAAHGYCSKTNTLAVQYKGNGVVYHYPNVKPETYEALKKADSVGKFVSKNIRHLKFDKV